MRSTLRSMFQVRRRGDVAAAPCRPVQRARTRLPDQGGHMIRRELDFRRLAVGRRRRIVVSLVTLVFGTTSVVVQARECPAVVVGTNDPATDVLNVQQAVDRCGSVLLQGKFSFAGMSTGDPLRAVTVRRSVNIVGQLDGQGRPPQIVGGTRPLLVDAPGAVVRIRRLRFVRSVSRAIQVGSAMEAVVTNCVIEAVEPVTIGDAKFGIVVGGPFESPINRLVVVGNTIADSSEPVEVGIILAPSSRAIGSIAISRNEVRATAHGIDLRLVRGNAQINDNRITIDNSDRTGDPIQFVDGIRCMGAGACSIVGNWIESHHPNSSGVRLQAATGAIVENNSIRMTPPGGSTPGAQSSGVQLIEDSKRNLVGRNRVSGAALTAFSVSGPLPLVPADNVLVLNRHPGFAPSFVDTEIGEGALRTVVVDESGSISDLGTGSVVR